MAEYTELPPEMGPEDQHESGDETHNQQQLVSVRINGRTMRMTPDDAQAWYEREQQFNHKLSQQGQELGELRQRINGIVSQQGQQSPSAPQGDPDLMFFQSPTATMTRLLDERERKIREEMAAERAEQTNQQRLAAELDRFKAGIYRAHPELRDHADAVEFQMNKQDG